jgi:hypothetical protein
MTLADYIAANLEREFAWGRWDCVHFAATWAQLATGIDHLAGVQPWRSKLGAGRALKEFGGLEACVDRTLNRVHPHLAKDGDIALVSNTLWIFSGPHLVAPGKGGLVFIDRTKAECAWSI